MGFEGRPDIVESPCEPREVARVELPEEPIEHRCAPAVDLVGDLAAGHRHPDEDDPPVARDSFAGHEPTLFHPVHEARGVGEGDPERFREPADRERSMFAQEPEHLEVGHADPGLVQMPRHGAALLSADGADPLGDPRDEFVAVLRSARRFGCRGISFDHRNNVGDLSNPVKRAVSRDRRTSACAGCVGPMGFRCGRLTLRANGLPIRLPAAGGPPMRYALMIEPQQGMSYADQLAVARRVEAGGFEALFRSDHYDSFPGELGRPTTDAWTVIAGLARETSRIHLGVLVSPVTFRTPGSFAKIVATAQEMSGGRIECGVGAGWNEGEHHHHGFPFPPIGERADMLEETLAILRGLWEGPDGWSFEGAHWSIPGSFFRARPEPVPPLIVGGEGSPRSMRLAARFADEFNLSSSTPERAVAKFAELDGVVAAAGRDPRSLRHSAMIGVLVGRTPEELAARESVLLAGFGVQDAAKAAAWFEARKPRWIHGLPDQAREQAARFAVAGLDRIVLQDFLPWDLEHIDLIAEVLVNG